MKNKLTPFLNNKIATINILVGFICILSGLSTIGIVNISIGIVSLNDNK
jgi:hypothetical protein